MTISLVKVAKQPSYQFEDELSDEKCCLIKKFKHLFDFHSPCIEKKFNISKISLGTNQTLRKFQLVRWLTNNSHKIPLATLSKWREFTEQNFDWHKFKNLPSNRIHTNTSFSCKNWEEYFYSLMVEKNKDSSLAIWIELHNFINSFLLDSKDTSKKNFPTSPELNSLLLLKFIQIIFVLKNKFNELKKHNKKFKNLAIELSPSELAIKLSSSELAVELSPLEKEIKMCFKYIEEKFIEIDKIFCTIKNKVQQNKNSEMKSDISLLIKKLIDLLLIKEKIEVPGWYIKQHQSFVKTEKKKNKKFKLLLDEKNLEPKNKEFANINNEIYTSIENISLISTLIKGSWKKFKNKFDFKSKNNLHSHINDIFYNYYFRDLIKRDNFFLSTNSLSKQQKNLKN